jgi:ribosome-binding factor A
MANAQRLRRLADQIQLEISAMLANELRDPRLSLVTITEVKVAQDLAHARVYYTTLLEGAARDDVARGLNRSSGFMRSLLGRRIRTHVTPELHFEYDRSIEHGMAIDRLIESAIAEERPDVPDDGSTAGG